MKQILHSLLILGIVFVVPLAQAQEYETLMPTSPLSIETSDGESHTFVVELAQTAEDRARGLMYRRTLPLDRGMLFNYHRSRRVSMWMKNTLIPLDMLFIDRSGIVVNIRERTIPHSLEAVSSRGKVLAVLELPGGSVDRLGIKRGDSIRHSIFSGK